MLFQIFISLLIKSSKAATVKITLGVQDLGIDITIVVTQNGNEIFKKDFKATGLSYQGVDIDSTLPFQIKLYKEGYCNEVIKTLTYAEISGPIDISSKDIPNQCRPCSVAVYIDTSMPSLYKFGYKINNGQIVAAESTTILASNLKSTDTLSLYLIESGYSGNYLLQTYQAEPNSFNTFGFNDIPEVCYLYEIQVSFVSIPNYYNFFYKIGNDEEQAITENLLHLSPIAKGTQVQIFVQSSSCPNFMNVGTFTTKVVSPNTASDEITENDIPSECASKFYLSFDFSELDIGNDVSFYYSEDGNTIPITHKSPISKQAPFSITIKVTSERSGCSEYKLGIFYGEKDNPQNIITITKEMLFKSQVPDSCIYPKRYIKISENFQNEYITLCRKVEDSIYGVRYYCKDSGEEYSEEYYGPQLTYNIYYLSAYCASESYDDNFRFIEEVKSNEDITKGTYEYGKDIIADECKTSYKILVDMKSEKDAKYTVPEGVKETKQSDDLILFTGETNFSITFTQERSECTNTLERTLYYIPPGHYSDALVYTYPYKQNLDFYNCIYSESEGVIIVVGVVIAIVAVVAIIVIIIVVVIRKRRQKANQANSSENQDANADEV